MIAKQLLAIRTPISNFENVRAAVPSFRVERPARADISSANTHFALSTDRQWGARWTVFRDLDLPSHTRFARGAKADRRVSSSSFHATQIP